LISLRSEPGIRGAAVAKGLVHRIQLGAVVVWVVIAGSACSSSIPVIELKRCGAAGHSPSSPELVADAHRAEFFRTHPLPLLQNQGGPILRNPKIVAVFFGNDPLKEETEAVAQSYGCTQYWKDAVLEYGVGELAYERSVVVPEFPKLEASDPSERIATWLADQKEIIGQKTDDRIYVLFAPADVPTVNCEEFRGYHSTFEKDGKELVYAVVGYCPAPWFGATPLSARVKILSHELMEASLDPFPASQPGWVGLDSKMLSSDPGGSENADLCNERSLAPDDYPLALASGWSNRRAQAGFDPCTSSEGTFVVPYPRSRVLDVTTPTSALDVDLFSEDPDASYDLRIDFHFCVSTGGRIKDGSTFHLSLSRIETGCIRQASDTRMTVSVFKVREPKPSEYVSTAYVEIAR
jgi:hypothetical protein